MSSCNNKLSLLFSAIALGVSVSSGTLLADPVVVSEVNDLVNLVSSGGEVEVTLGGFLEPWPPSEAYPSRSYPDGENFIEFHVYKFTPLFHDSSHSGSWLLYSRDAQEEGNKNVTGTFLANTAEPDTLDHGMTLFVADSVTAAE